VKRHVRDAGVVRFKSYHSDQEIMTLLPVFPSAFKITRYPDTPKPGPM